MLGSSYALKHGVKAQKVVAISGVCDFDYLVEEFCAELKLSGRLKARLHDEIRANLFPDLPLAEVPYSITDITGILRAPLLVIHDEDDTRIKAAQGRRLAAAFGDQARLVVTSGLGHRRILGDAEVIRTVLDFVADGPGPVSGGADARADVRD
ncbi:hypothetical protein GCM10020295_70670 [Streptomyces cinereospinus]